MRLQAIKKFSSPDLGHVRPGTVVHVPDARGRHLVDIGVCTSLEIKPDPKSYEAKPFVSRPGQASVERTLIDSGEDSQSQSTTATESRLTQTSSTPATPSGGKNTTRKRSRSKAKNGRKTSKQQKGTD